MQQTFLALAALMTCLFLNLGQIQTEHAHQRQVIKSEMEGMGGAVALEALEIVRSRAFDENTIGVPEEDVDVPDDFSDPDFTTGNYCKVFAEKEDSGSGSSTTECNDIDDFHKMKTTTIPFETPRFELGFKVNIEVQYVDENFEPVNQRTYRKKVTIRVQDAGEDPYLQTPIELSEVMTFY